MLSPYRYYSGPLFDFSQNGHIFIVSVTAVVGNGVVGCG